jgi:hypothetical protein
MTHSEATGADLSHAATVICRDRDHANVVMSNQWHEPCFLVMRNSDPPVGKQVEIGKIFGTGGAIMYCGNDRDRNSVV